jgi:hypothetical protein
LIIPLPDFCFAADSEATASFLFLSFYLLNIFNSITMKVIRYFSILSFLLTLFLFACQKDEVAPDPTLGLIKITEGLAEDADVQVQVWAKQELFAGYNPLYIALLDPETGEYVTESHVHLHPMMAMTGGMSHACPVTNPEDEFAVNKLFPAGIMFSMPTSDMGTWTLEVEVHNHESGNTGSVEFEINVSNPATPMMKSFTGADATKYYVSYYFPNTPKVGMNEVVLVVNRKETMMDYPAVENLTIGLEPEMPSMDHGSPNNVNPVHTASGHYKGQVNFTMTGEWRMHFTLTDGDEELQVLYFDVTVE